MSRYLQELIQGQGLEELILVQTAAGVTDVAEIVRMSPNLKVLDLSDNHRGSAIKLKLDEKSD